jgi:tetratricopeptide (TPR) repeat protein
MKPLNILLGTFLLGILGGNSAIAQEFQRPPEPTLLTVRVNVAGGGERNEQPLVELVYGIRRQDFGYVNSRGEIMFEIETPGMYRVRVSMSGYETELQQITITPGDRHRIFFELQPEGSGEGGAARGSPSPEVIEQMVEARQLRAKGDSEAAIETMEGVVEMAPEFAAGWMELGIYYWRAEKLEDATTCFEKTHELDPSVTGADLCLGQVLFEMGRVDEAQQILLRASESHPDRAEPLFTLAKMQADSGDLDQAERTAEQALTRDYSRVPQVHLLLAGIHAEKGDMDKEIASVESYLEVAPAGADLSRVETRLKLLRAELELQPIVAQYFSVLDTYRSGDRTGALNELGEVPRRGIYRAVERLRDRSDDELVAAAVMHTDAALLPESDASLHISRAAACVKRVEDDQRREDLDRRWNLTMAYYFQNRQQFLVAVPFLMELTKRYPDDREIRLAYGTVCEAAGLLNDKFRDHLYTAEEQYKWLLASVPDHIEARLRLGHVLKLLGKYEESSALLEGVLTESKNPDYIFVANLLIGDIHKIQGRLDRAIDSYRAAMEIDASSQVVVVAMSHTYHQARRLEQSTDLLMELLRQGERSESDTWWRYLSGNSARAESLLLELHEELAQ